MAYEIVTGTKEVLFIREDFEYSQPAFLFQWPSASKIAYYLFEGSFELDLNTGQVNYLLPDRLAVTLPYSPFTYRLRSPENEVVASFFSLSEFLSVTDSRNDFYNIAEREAIENTVIKWPGIEIYKVVSEETSTFDLDGQLVSAAAWSQDGTMLAIQTWPGDDSETAHGAYIYDLETNTMSPVSDLHPVRHTDPIEYGVFEPSWSADGEWVTLFGLEQGWVIYNLVENTITPLADQFQEPISMMSVPFTPLVNYTVSSCN